MYKFASNIIKFTVFHFKKELKLNVNLLCLFPKLGISNLDNHMWSYMGEISMDSDEGDFDFSGYNASIETIRVCEIHHQAIVDQGKTKCQNLVAHNLKQGTSQRLHNSYNWG